MSFDIDSNRGSWSLWLTWLIFHVDSCFLVMWVIELNHVLFHVSTTMVDFINYTGFEILKVC